MHNDTAFYKTNSRKNHSGQSLKAGYSFGLELLLAKATFSDKLGNYLKIGWFASSDQLFS